MFDELGRQVASELSCELLAALRLALTAQGLIERILRIKIEGDRLTFAPIGRNLKDGGTRKTTVGKERGLLKTCVVRCCACVGGCARQRREGVVREGKGNKGGARLCEAVTELRGDVIGQTCRAHFGNGFAACCEHEIAR